VQVSFGFVWQSREFDTRTSTTVRSLFVFVFVSVFACTINLTLFYFLLLHSTGKYLKDEEMAGRRRRNAAGGAPAGGAAGGAGAGGAGAGEEAATPAPAPTEVAVPAEAVLEAEESEEEEAEQLNVMDQLTRRLQQSASMKSYYHRERKQGLPWVAWSWMDGPSRTWYVTIRVELFGSIRARDIHPKIIGKGSKVRIVVKFWEGGELTDPAHLLMLQHHVTGFNENHPQHTALACGHRALSDAQHGAEELEDEVELLVDLPFQVDTNGFLDPYARDEDDLDVGVFPLDLHRFPNTTGRPRPSTSFLHLTCEELHKPVTPQRARDRSYFFN
jgi:hypothetical protein